MSSTTPQTTLPRYHSLDRLRATMMLLGVVLHSAINYFPFPENYLDQIYLDAKTSPFFDHLVKFIHNFRMPVFFVIAGFFAAFLFETRGPRAFLRHRMSRIGIPLLCAWVVLYPITTASMLYANSFSFGPKLEIPPPLHKILGSIFLHLWFLYFLIIFCVVAIPIALLVQHLRVDFRRHFCDAFERTIHRPYGIVLLAVISAATLYPMRFWTFDPAHALIPEIQDLAAYAVFFVFGWLVYTRRETVERFKQHAWVHFLFGAIFHGVYLYFYNQGYGNDNAVRTHVLALAALALCIWFLTYGFIGLFLRYLNKPSTYWRYMADASYWVYLIHLPITVVLPTFLTNLALPVGVKFGFVLSVTTVITLVTYHYLGRATFIGERLNGRRYPRVVPWREAP